MPRRNSSALIQHIRKLCGFGEEYLTASHIENRYWKPPSKLHGFPPPMADGRWRAADVDEWSEAISRDVKAGLDDLMLDLGDLKL
jgi:hypothetical protein